MSGLASSIEEVVFKKLFTLYYILHLISYEDFWVVISHALIYTESLFKFGIKGTLLLGKDHQTAEERSRHNKEDI